MSAERRIYFTDKYFKPPPKDFQKLTQTVAVYNIVDYQILSKWFARVHFILDDQEIPPNVEILVDPENNNAAYNVLFLLPSKSIPILLTYKDELHIEVYPEGNTDLGYSVRESEHKDLIYIPKKHITPADSFKILLAFLLNNLSIKVNLQLFNQVQPWIFLLMAAGMNVKIENFQVTETTKATCKFAECGLRIA